MEMNNIISGLRQGFQNLQLLQVLVELYRILIVIVILIAEFVQRAKVTVIQIMNAREV
jgi:hypothetical protein